MFIFLWLTTLMCCFWSFNMLWSNNTHLQGDFCGVLQGTSRSGDCYSHLIWGGGVGGVKEDILRCVLYFNKGFLWISSRRWMLCWRSLSCVCDSVGAQCSTCFINTKIGWTNPWLVFVCVCINRVFLAWGKKKRFLLLCVDLQEANELLWCQIHCSSLVLFPNWCVASCFSLYSLKMYHFNGNNSVFNSTHWRKTASQKNKSTSYKTAGFTICLWF